MKLIKELLQLNNEAKEASDEQKLPKAVVKFEKWYDKNDLWHPKFPEKFADCLYTLLEDESIESDQEMLEYIGKAVADAAHSFYGAAMVKFFEYVKKHPIPLEGDEEVAEKYVDKALKDI